MKCYKCGCEITNSGMEVYEVDHDDPVRVCDRCFHVWFDECPRCKKWFEKHDFQTVSARGGRIGICPRCFRSSTWVCRDCGVRFLSPVETPRRVSGRFVCNRCFSASYFMCPSCHRTLRTSDRVGRICLTCSIGSLEPPEEGSDDYVAKDIHFIYNDETRKIVEDPRSEI